MNSTPQLTWRSWGEFRHHESFLAVDLFAGGGGASEGIRRATGVPPRVAVNHDEEAIRMHLANHPETEHHQTSVYEVDPVTACRGRSPDLLWASPDCTHFSRAKGGKPRSKEIRSLAWVVVKDPIEEDGPGSHGPGWANVVRPRVIIVENVPEFQNWGPLHPDDHPVKQLRGKPIKERAGETFQRWVKALEAEGYAVEWREVRACDYGAPTTRNRLFVVARRDRAPVWPEPTHGPGREHPYRTAAECIDWSIPCPSIFERKRPLAEATQRRVAEGLRRYVLKAADPFIVRIGHQSSDAGKVKPADQPLTTITSKNEHCLVAPWLVNTRNGERKGQAPRTRDTRRPAPTITAQGSQGALVSAFLAKHYGGVVGHDLRRPLGTITATDHHSPVTVTLGGPDGLPHGRDVAAFCVKYYGSGPQGQGVDEPLHTIVSRDRFGLVTVELDGEPYTVVDIGLRMLQPRELARCQGFGDDYILMGTKRSKVAKIGNSVCPDVAEALVAAQFPELARRAEEAA